MSHHPPQNRRCTERGSGFGVQGSAKLDALTPALSQREREQARTALTLIELLLTLAVLGILAAILIPQLSGDLPERLNAAAQVVSTDLDYARALAVANSTSYAITFDPTNNLYYLRHTGTGAPQFDILPASPYRQTTDPPDKQTTNLSQLPLPEPGVQLVVAAQMQGAGQATTTLEFNSLGGTTSTYQTVIWLSCGSGLVKRYISVQVDPVTGMVTIGPTVTALPSSVTSLVQSGSVTAVQDNQAVSVQQSQTKIDSGS
jgi:prepilin-type N-terminal cleavage/methylation domain-containing protein